MLEVRLCGAGFLVALLLASAASAQSTPANEALWAAARTGDAAAIARALDGGAGVNAKSRYDVTALTYAAGSGHLAAVQLLLDRGADPNILDTFYKGRAVDMALTNGHLDVAAYLLERRSGGAPDALMQGIAARHERLVKASLAGVDIDAAALARGLAGARQAGDANILALVTAAAAARPAAPPPRAVTVDPQLLRQYVGAYRDDGGNTITVTLADGRLQAQPAGGPAIPLDAIDDSTFSLAALPGATLRFSGRAGTIEEARLTRTDGTVVSLGRAVAPVSSAPPPGRASAGDLATAPRGPRRDWPSFRGVNASGAADGQGAVATWDVASGQNVRWKTAIPGLGVSSPIVAGDRVFITTAVPSSGDTKIRTGLYGDVKPVDDLGEHTWQLYALDTRSGRILWQRDVFKGAPRTKRHPKSSQASATPVSDGRHVVAAFGSIGLLVCYDVEGKQLWKRELGVVDSGWFFDANFQWGHASSPIIYRDRVIVQADQQKGSFIAAYDLETGKEAWRTARGDEISTWGTPTIVSVKGRDELVTNGTKVRGYDPSTGALRWTLGPNSEITIGTPVAGDEFVYVTGGYPPVRPIYAIRPGASGDISLPTNTASSEAIAWSNDREGTYIPTPLVYRGVLYTLNVNGILTAYDAKSGQRVYRNRIGEGGSFSASLVASDGRLYVSSEDGDIFVIQAGREYAELGRHPMGEVIMSTPAIADGLILVRTNGHLVALGAPAR
jgi:outer membrane protein assembly factor BamB